MPRTTRHALTVLASALLGALAIVSSGGPVRGQAASPGAASSTSPTGVRDHARMFTPDALAQAETQLRAAETQGRAHWQLRIETLETLGDKSPSDTAAAISQAEHLKGVLVLMAKKQHHVWVFPTKEAAQVFSEREKAAIVDLVTESFKKGEFDAGLLHASAELRRAGIGFGVRDRAKMFTADSLAKADATLERIHKQNGWDIVVETVESLKGAKASDVALANAKALNIHGLYLLISKAEKAIQAEPSKTAKPSFTPEKIRQAEAAMTSAFRSGDNDKGLLDAVEDVRAAAESAPDRSAKPVVAARAPETHAATPGMHLPGPGDPPSKPSAASTPPPVSPVRPKPAPPAEAPAENPVPPHVEAPGMMTYVLIGGGVLVFLWIVKRLFARAPQQQNPNTGGYQPTQAYQPQQPGYAPQRPAPGPGYGPQQAGPGYAPAPPQGGGGGGFMSGMLGGLGGAVLGNVLYDHLGRPVSPETHPQGYPPTHDQGQAPIPETGPSPTQGGSWSDPATDPNTGQSAESYDPNAGVGTTWGTPDSAPSPDPAGGDWDAPEAPPDDPGTGGDWGGAEPAPDADNGGDWGGDAGGGNDAGTGGDW